MADRGGLAEPADYCLATNAYEQTHLGKIHFTQQPSTCIYGGFVFFCSNIRDFQDCFFANLLRRMLNNFKLNLQTAFNCFAKNELKRLNHCIIDAPQKMSRTVHKPSAKSSKE